MPDLLSNAMVSEPIAAFACELFAQPAARADDCLAKLYGLRGASSLHPWLRDGVNDVEELARRDYQPDFGDAWQEEWERQKDEALIILEGRCGREWPAAIADRVASSRQDAMATKRQDAM